MWLGLILSMLVVAAALVVISLVTREPTTRSKMQIFELHMVYVISVLLWQGQSMEIHVQMHGS